jgi:hypothetical protein
VRLDDVVRMSFTRRPWLGLIALALAACSLSGCAPLPIGEYWGSSYVHLDPPRYTFDVPDGWRQATPSDYASLGFNRRGFARLDEAGRRSLLERAELELQAIDTGLISSGGAWIQVGSEARSGGWYSSSNPLQYGLSEKDKQGLWERFARARTDNAPASDKPTLTLEAVDVVDYGLNRFLRVRFRSDEARGSLYWTVLGFFNSTDTVSLAHVGTPENREEGLAALETIAKSLRFD